MLGEFFGGAITAELPDGLIDASDLRQIPDTQEVLLSPNSDVTYILEILQSVDAEDLSEAIRFHFDSLAHDNDAVDSKVENVVKAQVDRTAPQPSPYLLRGTQFVRKFNRPIPDQVELLMALFRVPHKGADVVLTVNVPTRTQNPETKAIKQEEWEPITQAFYRAVETFQIVDFDLFA